MNSIAVFVKRSGLVIACRAHPAPDGCTWQCGACGLHPLLRVSFGVMSGLWRCSCGAGVELYVDGEPVSIEKVAQMTDKGAPESAQQLAREAPNVPNVPAKPRRKRTRKLSDQDFLRECGIAIEGDKNNARSKNSD